MRIHHLNCISSCRVGLACHCLLVDAGSQLVLVDTGYGMRDVANPEGRLSRFFRALLRPDLREEMTAVRQVARLGYDPRDVRHIVLTHLDFDHAGGLDDFPWAAVHMLTAERVAAEAQETVLDRMRFRPQQWSTQRNWRTYPYGQGQKWFGFDAVRDLYGLPPEILLVPLVGHTLGHAGVAIRHGKGWALHAGDAYFCASEMDRKPSCTPGLALYQWMMDKDRFSRRRNQAQLRSLCQHHASEVRVFCSHDSAQFERMTGHPAGRPTEPMTRAAYR